ncbi:trimeric intracellular cation channel family protein [Chitinophaga sedimenti]|uniref:trimeric intracellular cation channel family protein n=1 Tax=Chitinophaga sedimenti TaxID=2033606 RepID=UPI0020043497|nr:trimeric intracellular cation channel family protein [Chitinophaga sedimenti]MCK7559201.1 trimeric intracellular cation channel family protein [Chitinophaga sedimenti]
MMIYWIDIIGTFTFAISGALAAWDKKMYHDLFGVFFTGFITAIGGGTLRDVTLGVHPIAWVKDAYYILAISTGVLLTIFFRKRLQQYRKSLLLFDTIGIGFYTILGVEKSLQFGVNPLAAVILGMMSAIFGGVIRDMMVNEIPLIFSRQIYATACLAGGVIFVLLRQLGVPENVNEIVGIITVISIRIISLKRGWSLPHLSRNS